MNAEGAKVSQSAQKEEKEYKKEYQKEKNRKKSLNQPLSKNSVSIPNLFFGIFLYFFFAPFAKPSRPLRSKIDPDPDPDSAPDLESVHVA